MAELVRRIAADTARRCRNQDNMEIRKETRARLPDFLFSRFKTFPRRTGEWLTAGRYHLRTPEHRDLYP